MSKNLEIRKLPVIQKLIALQDEDVFLVIEQLLNPETEKDWATELSSHQKQSIEKGLDDVKNDKIMSFEEVKAKYNKTKE